ncbi:MAG: hypothetical protein S4CHLAM7_13000 [Chlamydiae bacterium]|nr:hypothetical protein [Chlamydiota bacterium]
MTSNLLSTNSTSSSFFDLPHPQTNLFNFSQSNFFDPPPPPEGPGSGVSAQFNRPTYTLIPYMVINETLVSKIKSIFSQIIKLSEGLLPTKATLAESIFEHLGTFKQLASPPVVIQCFPLFTRLFESHEEAAQRYSSFLDRCQEVLDTSDDPDLLQSTLETHEEGSGLLERMGMTSLPSGNHNLQEITFRSNVFRAIDSEDLNQLKIYSEDPMWNNANHFYNHFTFSEYATILGKAKALQFFIEKELVIKGEPPCATGFGPSPFHHDHRDVLFGGIGSSQVPTRGCLGVNALLAPHGPYVQDATVLSLSHLAALFGQVEILQLLHERGFDVHSPQLRDEITPLLLCLKNMQKEVVATTISHNLARLQDPLIQLWLRKNPSLRPSALDNLQVIKIHKKKVFEWYLKNFPNDIEIPIKFQEKHWTKRTLFESLCLEGDIDLLELVFEHRDKLGITTSISSEVGSKIITEGSVDTLQFLKQKSISFPVYTNMAAALAACNSSDMVEYLIFRGLISLPQDSDIIAIMALLKIMKYEGIIDPSHRILQFLKEQGIKLNDIVFHGPKEKFNLADLALMTRKTVALSFLKEEGIVPGTFSETYIRDTIRAYLKTFKLPEVLREISESLEDS